MVRGVVAGGGKPHPMPASRAPLSQALAGAGRHLAACAFDLRLGSHVFPSEMGGISPWPISHCAAATNTRASLPWCVIHAGDSWVRVIYV